jgi:hypothetical protein
MTTPLDLAGLREKAEAARLPTGEAVPFEAHRPRVDDFIAAASPDVVLELVARVERAEANYRFMVERAADEKLDGYRELAASVLAATQRAERAEGALSKLSEWTHIFGEELKPRGADTYGEGVRDSKERVARILAALSTPPPVTP